MSTKLINKYSRPEVLLFVGIAILFILQFLLNTRLTSNSIEFINSYKFVSADSYDWLANGLRIFENDSISFRNPGLVLIIRLLHMAHVLFLLPLLGLAAFFFMVLYTYKSSGLVGNKNIALVLALFLGLNYTFNMAAIYILADIYAAAFICASVYYILKRAYFRSFFLLGLSMLFQNIAIFLVGIWVLFYLINDFDRISSRFKAREFKYFAKLGFKLALALLPLLIWSLYRQVKFGNPFYTRLDYLELLSPNLHSIRYYLFNSVVIFGFILVPATLFFLFSFKKYKRNKEVGLLLAGLIFNTLFWVFFYNWDDRRFLIYFVPFVYPLIAYAFSGLKLNKNVKFALLVLVLYPTILPVSSYLTGNELPIAHNYYLKINTKSETSYFDSRLEERDKYASPVMNVYPAFYQAIRNHSFNHKLNSSTFYSYSVYTQRNYDPQTHIICVDKKAGTSKYVARTTLVINNNVNVDLLRYHDCPVKNK